MNGAANTIIKKCQPRPGHAGQLPFDTATKTKQTNLVRGWHGHGAPLVSVVQQLFEVVQEVQHQVRALESGKRHVRVRSRAWRRFLQLGGLAESDGGVARHQLVLVFSDCACTRNRKLRTKSPPALRCFRCNRNQGRPKAGALPHCPFKRGQCGQRWLFITVS